MSPSDLARTALAGLKATSGRSAMTILGIAIGVASMFSVVGISSSSRADIADALEKLGTNVLVVKSGSLSLDGTEALLPINASARLEDLPAILKTSPLIDVDTDIIRTNIMPPGRNGGVQVSATDPRLVDTLRGTVADGRFLTADDTKLPLAVLGSEAAQRLGIRTTNGRSTVLIGEQPFIVIGILNEFGLYPDIDRTALIGVDVADDLFATGISPDRIYLRANPLYVEQVAAVAARTANPADPSQVKVSRPSATLEAKSAINNSLTNLLVGLGLVALIVGGLGIANVMIAAVTERRGEIGIRRALGASRSLIATQFVAESAILAVAGGIVGIGIGSTITALYARREGWPTELPLLILAGGVTATLILGVISGLLPAIRAATQDPAEAVRAGVG